MSEPKKFIAGTLQEWTRDHEYAYGLWSFSYVFVGPKNNTIICTADAGLVSVILPSVDTAAWPAGKYGWFLIREKDAEKVHVDKGFMYVEANPFETAEGADQLSHAECVLASIEKRIESRVLSDHENYSIDGRALTRISIMDLRKLQKDYKWLVHQEKVKRGEVKPFTGKKVRLK
jgi:hypothetical protein